MKYPHSLTDLNDCSDGDNYEPDFSAPYGHPDGEIVHEIDPGAPVPDVWSMTVMYLLAIHVRHSGPL